MKQANARVGNTLSFGEWFGNESLCTVKNDGQVMPSGVPFQHFTQQLGWSYPRYYINDPYTTCMHVNPVTVSSGG